MYTKPEIIKLLRPVVQGISALDGVEKIILFGSFARGQQTITSDVDLAVIYTSEDARSLVSAVTTGLYAWYDGDMDIQPTYIPREEYLHDQHQLNVSSSVRKDGIILWQK
jgi:predicted nucleotidyltransferase